MKTQVRFTVAALALALAAPALAQDDPAADPVLRMNDAVNTAALTRLGDLLPPGDVLRLFAVARQEALATSCDGYELDMARYTAVLNDILAGLREGTEPGAENLPVDVAMSAYSVVLGGQIAVGASIGRPTARAVQRSGRNLRLTAKAASACLPLPTEPVAAVCPVSRQVPIRAVCTAVAAAVSRVQGCEDAGALRQRQNPVRMRGR